MKLLLRSFVTVLTAVRFVDENSNHSSEERLDVAQDCIATPFVVYTVLPAFHQSGQFSVREFVT